MGVVTSFHTKEDLHESSSMQGPGAGPMAGEEKDAGVRSLIDVNGLAYRMTPGLSVATSRVVREWDALRNEYSPGNVMAFAISSGAAYVDPDNSFIKFTIKLEVKGKAKKWRMFWGEDTKGRQTALNLFTDMRLTHSSGYEIDRVNRGFAPWNYIRLAYTKDQQWWDTYGSLMRGFQTSFGTAILPAPGVGPTNDFTFYGNDGSGGGFTDQNTSEDTKKPVQRTRALNAASYNDVNRLPTISTANNTDSHNMPVGRPFGYESNILTSAASAGTIYIDVALPLSSISGVWDTDTLSPSFLMAGARLDLTVASFAQAFQTVSTDGTAPKITAGVDDVTMTLTRPKLVLETITFTDAVLRSISMTSASSGLEIPFVAMHYSQAPLAQASASIQINRGLSRANMVIIRPYPVVTTQPDALEYDCNKVYYWPTSTPSDSQEWNGGGGFQAKLGAEFMPNRPVDNPLQMYHTVQNAFGNWKSDRRNTVTLEDYMGRGETAGQAVYDPAFSDFPVQSCLGCMAQSLEKSSTLAQSGSPISAARDLNVVWGPVKQALFSAAKYGVDSSWKGMIVDIFVPYVCLATVYLDSVLTRS
jgi:hypothetical protein